MLDYSKLRIAYCSLGCKVNLYESVAITNEFVDKGFKLVEFDEVSDIYLINTCTVTSTSDSKSRKMIRQAIKKNPDAVIVVMGCYSQLNPEVIKKIPGVDLVLGVSKRDQIFELATKQLLLKQNKQDSEQNCYVSPFKELTEYEELKIKYYNHKTRGFVKIQDGCNNFCSYCTIPYARGTIKSRKKENVIEEIQTLCDNNMKEIVLSGINTGTYGKDLNDYTLACLLKDIVKNVKNLGRIRISSIEVTEITDELLTVIKENKEHFCMHLHIPIQGGCNSTLKRMNRKYTIEYYENKINKIRNFFPDINITTDCLAGFNGETEEDFINTMDFIKRISYGEMHVFPYSPRPLTIAYKFPDRIDEITKKFRVNQLLSINNELALKYRNNFLNKELDVLVEKNEDGIAFGHTSNYLEVQFKSDIVKPNDLVKVKLVKIGYPISKGIKTNV